MRLPFPLQDSEAIQAVARRHWLYLYPRLALFALVAVVPVIVVWLSLGFADLRHGLGTQAGIVVTVLWLLFWGFRTWLLKYQYDNDIWTVTDQRIIDSTRNHPFNLRIATADLIDVVDTSVTRSGVFRTMFDYGDIWCETAGERQNFSLNGVPKPRELHALIDKMRDRSRVETYRGPEAVERDC